MSGTGPASTDWWREAFAEHYSDVYHHRDDAAATAEIAGLLPRLRAAPGPVLDACCGGGRHLAAMRAAGLEAYGFDFSAHLLAQAQARPSVAGRVARGDIRAPPFVGGFGAITLLFTAFGYFDDAVNEAVLRGLAKLVMPGGWIVLDQPDPGWVAKHLVATSTRSTPGGLHVQEQRKIRGDRVEKAVEVSRQEITVAAWTESVRLYALEQIRSLATSAGLMLVETWPSLTAADSGEGRSVCWLRQTSINPGS